MEGENFGKLMALKSLARKKFGESVGSLLKTLALINIGGENFGELPTIRQNFPPPKFSHVRYVLFPVTITRAFNMTVICMHIKFRGYNFRAFGWQENWWGIIFRGHGNMVGTIIFEYAEYARYYFCGV